MPIRRLSGAAPLVLFAAAVAGFGAALPDYSQRLHPVALLGGTGIAHAAVFNVLAFVLPGVLAGLIAWRLRMRLPPDSAWPARIGAWLALLSALAFAAQGVLPLDPADPDAHASRLHYVTWMLWWLAFVPAGLLLAAGLRGAPGWRASAAASLASAIVVGACVVLPSEVLPAAVSQRVGFAAWLAWLALQPGPQGPQRAQPG